MSKFCLVLRGLLSEHAYRAYSSAGLERTPDKREVDGSSPFRLIHGELAQLGERLPCTQEVSGSIPLFSIKQLRLFILLFFEN